MASWAATGLGFQVGLQADSSSRRAGAPPGGRRPHAAENRTPAEYLPSFLPPAGGLPAVRAPGTAGQRAGQWAEQAGKAMGKAMGQAGQITNNGNNNGNGNNVNTNNG